MKHLRSPRWIGLIAALATTAVTAQALPGVRAVPQPAAPAAATGMPGAGASPSMAAPGSSGLRSGFAPAPTQVLGNAGRGHSIVYMEAGSSGLSAADVARSFRQADANGDGILTAAEAQQLAIRPSSFEEMDSNHDERLTRAEYEAAASR